MRNIINRDGVVQDDWLLLRPDAQGLLPPHTPEQDVIVPVDVWRADPTVWQARPGRCGVWLAPDAEPAQLASHWNLLTLVAVDFPNFTDGRGYSLARLLRERHSYAGELRAVGDVWGDQLQALWLVGFDSFEIKPGKPLPAAGFAQQGFSEQYQASFREPRPLFRRCSKST